MKCPNCGEEIPEGKKFCGFCGTKIVEPAIVQPPSLDPVVVHAKTTQSFPKWLFWVIPIGLIVIGLIMSILFNWIPRQMILSMFAKEETAEDLSSVVSNPSDESIKSSDDDQVRMEIAGEWVGIIGGEEWSTTLEVSIDQYCKIGSICGTYNVVNSDSHGELEFISKSGFEYTFLEHPLGEENIPGGGYQTMILLDDQNLEWSFEQELPSKEIMRSDGVLVRK